MRRFPSPGALILAFGLVLLPSQTAQAQDTEMFATGPVNASFVPVPGFPKGADFYVVHGNPMEAFEMFFRLQPGVRVPMHFHTSAERAVGVQGVITMEFEDGTKSGVAPGTYMFIPGKAPHAATCPSGDSPCIAYFYFEKAFDVTWVGEPPSDPNPMPEAGS